MREGRQLLSNLETSRKEADADTRWDMTQDWDTMQRYRVWSSNSVRHKHTHTCSFPWTFWSFLTSAVCVPAGCWLSSQIWRWLLMASLINITSNCSSIYNCWDTSTVFRRWTNFLSLTSKMTSDCFRNDHIILIYNLGSQTNALYKASVGIWSWNDSDHIHIFWVILIKARIKVRFNHFIQSDFWTTFLMKLIFFLVLAGQLLNT